jgi:hypothetical protein
MAIMVPGSGGWLDGTSLAPDDLPENQKVFDD